MINKELLSEVLKYPMEVTTNVTYYISIISEPYFLDGNKTAVYFNTDNVGLGVCKINIYELAHKCKEWAHKSEYYINSGQMDKNSLENTLKWFATIFNPHKRIGEKQTLYGNEMLMTFFLDTEHEAIFKACEWILANK